MIMMMIDDQKRLALEHDAQGGRRSGVAYRVMPAAQMSPFTPEKRSAPEATSGGWKAGEPWDLGE
jgi:hypothetical protein